MWMILAYPIVEHRVLIRRLCLLAVGQAASDLAGRWMEILARSGSASGPTTDRDVSRYVRLCRDPRAAWLSPAPRKGKVEGPPRTGGDLMPGLMVDVITSLDGFSSAEGWPGLWGMGGP